MTQESPLPDVPEVQDPKDKGAGGEIEDRQALDQIREQNRTRRIEYLKAINPQLPELVEQWKQRWGRIESVHILGEMYIWRGMDRAEYIGMMTAGLDKNKNEEAIASKCLLWPEISTLDWVKNPAGLPTTLSDLVLASSGFGTEDPIPVRL